ncbi:hypothetical protein BHM03_00061411 [Ensete ventricosum]|nr:hypothetical protein BHM03_00061411 [Ensete ventricosum]
MSLGGGGDDENIILNPAFDDGLNNWSGRGCQIALHDSTSDGTILPLNGGKYFASATGRTQSWNGIQQEITGRVERKLAYEVAATVRVLGGSTTTADVTVNLYVQGANGRDQYIGVAKAVVFIDGPPAGVDLLLNSLVVKHAAKNPPPSPPDFQNSNLVDGSDGLNGWFPLGSCKLTVTSNGAPHVLPPMAKESLGTWEPLNGRYILVTSRTQTWMGAAQAIDDKLHLHATYQVSAWVRVGPQRSGPQNIGVSLGVDGKWISGGQVEAKDGRWYEVGGSFRIEKQPSKVIVSVQGPASGVDLMVAGLQIFPVDRTKRFKGLKKLTDKVIIPQTMLVHESESLRSFSLHLSAQVRKRDVVVKISGSGDDAAAGSSVRVTQIKNSFPLGSCIMRTNMDNEDFVDFFVKNFNWAVFGNELKWYWTEPQKGSLNYADADELLELCRKNGMEARGHCIFWEVESAVQNWVRSLNKEDLSMAVQNRINGLLTRYKDQFRHYDVNNEMLHGSFYRDRLGEDIGSYMFKTANQLDPSATLFVNDYNVEGAVDTRASPEMYMKQILGLQEQDAPVGGIGLQGHVTAPVGPVVSSALDKLSVLGLPIWFTELDAPASNEYVRADDLEVMLREAFAHPSVEGIMLWGFWELFMFRGNAHLVNAEGELNEAGKRFLMLKQEWLSHARGRADDQGEFKFRGFHGTYRVEIITPNKKKLSQTFTVAAGDSALVVNINP